MTDPNHATSTQGHIYDLGYRHYEGPRLGRRYAVQSLISLSLRNVFGFGRGTLPKVLAGAFTAMAVIPAIVSVGTSMFLGDRFTLVEPAEFFSFVQLPITLFVATMASELVGTDNKNNILPLYFSRPIRRDDYALSKIAALAIALLALTLIPQLLMFLANWLSAEDSIGWLRNNASELLRIAAASVLVSVQLGAIGVVIAMLSSRRAVALISVLAVFFVSSAVVSAVANLTTPGWTALAMALSPPDVMAAASAVIFDAVPDRAGPPSSGAGGELVAYADLPSLTWVGALLAQTAIATLLAVRHYRKVSR